MVAYSLKPRFIVPVLVGLGMIDKGSGTVAANGFEISTFVRMNLPPPKRQTIRAKGKRRHARPGETLQLYTGMRTRQCKLIGLARCVSIQKVTIQIKKFSMWIEVDGVPVKGGNIHAFARADGFGSGEEMLEFWHTNHKGVKRFDGFLIKWEPFKPGESIHDTMHSDRQRAGERRRCPGPEQRKARRRAAR